jgi:hypothetical protein
MRRRASWSNKVTPPNNGRSLAAAGSRIVELERQLDEDGLARALASEIDRSLTYSRLFETESSRDGKIRHTVVP